MKDYNKLLDQLKAGELDRLQLAKEEFLTFREVLIRRDDFKHFRGEAGHNGAVRYTYAAEPRN